ncbi:hypothetical protein MJL79_31450, partial [Salmonella enterica subsp. enterica serovar Montevideo]|nr:hypothetical protein [Salmonella enterica subsp. enterica serovar Montevideo]
APNESTPGLNGAGLLYQGYVETSNVNVAEELVNMIQVQRAYEVWLTQGGAKYLDWHNALYATGKVEGALTEHDVYTLAQHYLTP